MPQFFIILLKINLVLLLFAAAYYLILRRLTFYTINRLFLVFGILFSTVYPFINLTDFFHSQQQLNQEVVAFVPKLNQQVNSLVPSHFIAVNWPLLSLLFYVGVAFMAFRLLIQFVSLYRMHKKSAPGAVSNYPVRILDEPVSPFSFWQTVYINPSLHPENELQTILAHEQIHVKEWHSLDIILAELSVVFYWFNPGVWLMKKAVKENLEFITDQKILNKGIDKKTYQYSLLDVGNLTPAVAIVNNFNLSDLKKRIKMMNLKRSSKLTLSRYLLVTPILLLTTLAFTISKKDFKKHLIPLQQALVSHHIMDVPIPQKTVKKTIKKLKVPTGLKAKRDTTKFTFFIKSLFITGDSTHKPTLELRQFNQNVKIRGTVSGAKGSAGEKFFMISTDSLSKEGTIRHVENLRLQLKEGVPFPNADHTTAKMIVVKGFPMAKSIDSLSNGKVAYFLNGKEISAEEFRASLIKPDDIKNVSIDKKTDKVTGVRVVTRDN